MVVVDEAVPSLVSTLSMVGGQARLGFNQLSRVGEEEAT